jgi:pimeloyl-ACP methyl ester carboxylesterase
MTRTVQVFAVGALFALLGLSASGPIQSPPISPKASPGPADKFATANGVRLHYLDWGGSGDALLFLTSLGGTAADFAPLAAALTDHFHVLGLTRRGQGLSDKPETGYDTSTLARDIEAFLDAMAIERVTLVGYSLAGNEMTEFAGVYPRRVASLVYLDAAYDLAENKELGKQLHLPPLRGDRATQQLIDRSDEYHPDYSRIQAPALGFFVTYDEPPANAAFDEETRKKLLAWWYDYGKAYRREQIDRFRAGVEKATVVELHGTTHGGFVFEEKQQAILIREMRKFLLTGGHQ